MRHEIGFKWNASLCFLRKAKRHIRQVIRSEGFPEIGVEYGKPGGGWSAGEFTFSRICILIAAASLANISYGAPILSIISLPVLVTAGSK